MPGRIVLLVTSPRLPAGLLTAQAWDVLRRYPVFAARPAPAIEAQGVPVAVTDAPLDALLGAARARGGCVWVAGPDGDEALARELGLRLAREPSLAELELMYGSWDPPGARMLDAVTVMDRLASPGGDPWKRAQTHESLAHFLLEEAYEAYDAIVAGDSDALREELGDVLLQVVLHARLAENLPEGSAWNIDDLAGELVEKLIRRNPHVFGDAPTQDIDEIIEQWERIKKAEKRRDSALEGIAWSQPALALAGKVRARAGRAGVAPDLPTGESLGERLLRLVATEPE
ncbi:MAG TPA: MazG family protein, partial [Rugosimonospora sp.]|nr:MazG family protein [Rugosimonospora sp.]